MNKMPVIKDVAHLAGVSITTVSYVMNNSKPVADATRIRVEDAMNQLGYRPNLMARGLKTKKTGMIGVVIPDLYSSYFSRLLAEVEETLYTAGLQMLLCNSKELFVREKRFIDMMTHQMEGLIITPSGPAACSILTPWDSQSCPLVFVDRKPIPMTLAPYVTTNNERAGKDVFDHLYERYDLLALVSPHPAQGAVQERIAGFMSAAIKHGIKPITSFAKEETGTMAGRAQIERILQREKRSLGVFCTTNAATIGCVTYLSAEGIAMGSKVGVVGYDDTDWMVLTQPTISSVRTDPELIGRRAAKAMVDQMHGIADVQSLEVAAQLIVRESSLSTTGFKEMGIID